MCSYSHSQYFGTRTKGKELFSDIHKQVAPLPGCYAEGIVTLVKQRIGRLTLSDDLNVYMALFRAN